LDSLIENLKDKACIRNKSSLGNRIFYDNKTRGVLAKNNEKNKKNKKAKYSYYLQENPRYDVFYVLRRISKSERYRSRGKQRMLQNRNRRSLRRNRMSTSIQIIIIDILL
jgi:hypothetical protein